MARTRWSGSSEVEKCSSKVLLVGDPEKLQSIEVGEAFRSITERHGARETTEVRCQRENYQQNAKCQLAASATTKAIDAYDDRDSVHVAATRDEARPKLIDRWKRKREALPGGEPD